MGFMCANQAGNFLSAFIDESRPLGVLMVRNGMLSPPFFID